MAKVGEAVEMIILKEAKINEYIQKKILFQTCHKNNTSLNGFLRVCKALNLRVPASGLVLMLRLSGT